MVSAVLLLTLLGLMVLIPLWTRKRFADAREGAAAQSSMRGRVLTARTLAPQSGRRVATWARGVASETIG